MTRDTAASRLACLPAGHAGWSVVRVGGGLPCRISPGRGTGLSQHSPRDLKNSRYLQVVRACKLDAP